MSQDTFYWFDYETWGISPQWDRPAQFAGIRTDAELNVIGQPTMLYCQLPPDYLPNPAACLVTGLQPEFVNSNGLSEPNFMREVVQLLGAKGTCSVGYNSIRFDDEVTRHALFRNFRDPYRHEWHDGNSRWDLLDVVRLTRALRPDGIQWPVDEHGKPNNKLENLTAANGLAHNQAHDALSDVYATIAVASLIKQKQPRLYDFALTLRRKQTVAELLNWQTKAPLLHISGMVPMDRYHTSIVVPLLRHPTNANGVIVLDMRTDPEALIGLDVEQIRQRLFGKNLRPEQRLHIRTVHINRCPMVAPIATLTQQDAARIGLDRSGELERATRVHLLDQEQLDCISEAMIHQDNEHTAKLNQAIARCPEASLYSGGFLSESDRQRATKISGLAAEQLIGFSEAAGYFDDARLTQLLANYRARYAKQTLTLAELTAWRDDCLERLNETREMPWLTFQAFDQIMRENEALQRDERSELRKSLELWRAEVEFYLQSLESV